MGRVFHREHAVAKGLGLAYGEPRRLGPAGPSLAAVDRSPRGAAQRGNAAPGQGPTVPLVGSGVTGHTIDAHRWVLPKVLLPFVETPSPGPVQRLYSTTRGSPDGWQRPILARGTETVCSRAPGKMRSAVFSAFCAFSTFYWPFWAKCAFPIFFLPQIGRAVRP